MDAYKLQRFVSAQMPVWEQVITELRAGEKRTHWMWFVFPQFKGLGQSEMAQRYAISSEAEAAAYLQHDLLGSRLRLCCETVNNLEGYTVDRIFGYPDNLKFHSSVTLFDHIAHESNIYADVLHKYFNGKRDAITLQLLGF
jgi:uncharacterized protein (DUF1810 family)